MVAVQAWIFWNPSDLLRYPSEVRVKCWGMRQEKLLTHLEHLSPLRLTFKNCSENPCQTIDFKGQKKNGYSYKGQELKKKTLPSATKIDHPPKTKTSNFSETQNSFRLPNQQSIHPSPQKKRLVNWVTPKHCRRNMLLLPWFSSRRECRWKLFRSMPCNNKF